MSADLYLHVIEAETKEDVEEVLDAPPTYEGQRDLNLRLMKLPHVWIGEWADTVDTTFDPVSDVADAIGEDYSMITNDLIKEIEKTLRLGEQLDFLVNEPEEVAKFLREHKGKRCIAITW